VVTLEVHLLRQRLGIGLEDVFHQRLQIIIAGTLQKLAGIADIDDGHYRDSFFLLVGVLTNQSHSMGQRGQSARMLITVHS